MPTTGRDKGVRGIDSADPGMHCWILATDMNPLQIPAGRILNTELRVAAIRATGLSAAPVTSRS